MASSGNLFLQGEGTLIALTEQPYDAETLLQGLLAEHPELLPGEDLNPTDPLRFLLVRREAPLEGFELDHLFVDQHAVPTLVETKRSSDTRGRREVVAQMLDYASLAAEVKAVELAAWLAQRCAAAGLDPDVQLVELDHGLDGSEEFWAQAEQNLRDGKIRLIFVSDEISPTLKRIVEWLNGQLSVAEVLAVEVRQYRSAGDQRLLQSTVVGATERSRNVKGQNRQPAVLPTLVEHGHLQDGVDLWLIRSKLPADIRPESDDDPRLRFTLRTAGGPMRLAYQPSEEAQVEELSASRSFDRARRELDLSFTGDRARAVHDVFAIEPGGSSLGEVAKQQDLWS